MTLSLDSITVGAEDADSARAFYLSALAPAGDTIGVERSEAIPAGFQGYTVSYIVAQPTEVQAVLDAAADSGANVIKPAKKVLFGAFSGVFQAPDGSLWKVAAPTKKDTGPAGNPPQPTEIAALLGVSEPKKSKSFYEALGMTTDRDYGNKYIDFAPTGGACRLGLMTVGALANDVGAGEMPSGRKNVVLNHRAESRSAAKALVRSAESAGGSVLDDDTDSGFVARFTDLDGYVWRVVAD